MNQNHLLLYKMYHLNKIGNTIFIDNQDLKIAVLKQVQKQGNDFYINYGLYFKTEQQSLNLKAYIKNAMKFETIWTSQTEIQQNLQKRQIQLLEVSIKSNLSEILVIPILEVNYNNKIQQVFLPIQILSLIQYYKISKIVYQRKWKSAKVYRSEMFEYNTIILSNHRDTLNELFKKALAKNKQLNKNNFGKYKQLKKNNFAKLQIIKQKQFCKFINKKIKIKKVNKKQNILTLFLNQVNASQSQVQKRLIVLAKVWMKLNILLILNCNIMAQKELQNLNQCLIIK